MHKQNANFALQFALYDARSLKHVSQNLESHVEYSGQAAVHNMIPLLKQVKQLFNAKNFYDLLEIDKNSSQNDIKKAYLQRSLQIHPDKTHEPDEKEIQKRRFQILTQVYQILSDEASRKDYDQILGTHTTVIDEDSNYREEINLNVCQEDDLRFTYECRCSGKFILAKDELSSRDSKTSYEVYIVDCDSCSNSIKLVVN